MSQDYFDIKITPGEVKGIQGLDLKRSNIFNSDLYIRLKRLDEQEIELANRELLAQHESAYFNMSVKESSKDNIWIYEDIVNEDETETLKEIKRAVTLDEYFKKSKEKKKNVYPLITETLSILAGSSVEVDIDVLDLRVLEAVREKQWVDKDKINRLIDYVHSEVINCLEEDSDDYRIVFIRDLNRNQLMMNVLDGPHVKEESGNINYMSFDPDGEESDKPVTLSYISIIKVLTRIEADDNSDLSFFESQKKRLKSLMPIREDYEFLMTWCKKTKRPNILTQILLAVNDLGEIMGVNLAKKF